MARRPHQDPGGAPAGSPSHRDLEALGEVCAAHRIKIGTAPAPPRDLEAVDEVCPAVRIKIRRLDQDPDREPWLRILRRWTKYAARSASRSGRLDQDPDREPWLRILRRWTKYAARSGSRSVRRRRRVVIL